MPTPETRLSQQTLLSQLLHRGRGGRGAVMVLVSSRVWELNSGCFLEVLDNLLEWSLYSQSLETLVSFFGNGTVNKMEPSGNGSS